MVPTTISTFFQKSIDALYFTGKWIYYAQWNINVFLADIYKVVYANPYFLTKKRKSRVIKAKLCNDIFVLNFSFGKTVILLKYLFKYVCFHKHTQNGI